jgi:hypothetical protein
VGFIRRAKENSLPENEEPSINQLRALVTASAGANAETETETPAAAEKDAKTAPASEPATQETERGIDGKFKAAKADDEPAVTPNVQKRIDKAVKAQREAERQRDEALAKTQVSPPAKEKAPPAAPKQEDFQTYDEYSRAIARFEARTEIDKELATQREAGAKAQRDAEQARRAADFGAAEVEARKTHADYDEVTSGIEWPKAPGTSALADYLLETNNAALYYELGKQPEEIARMAAMSPVRAVAALAKFEASLEAPPADRKTTVKELPKPPRNVGGGGTPTVVDLNDPKLDMRGFKREFARRLKAGND